MGVVWLTLAKFYFMGTGLVLLLILPALFKRFAGEQHVDLYGDYRTVAGLANWFNMVLIGGTIQAVSKFVSEREGRTHSVKWQTFKLQAIIGGGAAIALFFGADLVAEHFYEHPALAFYMRLAAPIVLLYSFYAVIIGCLNGLKRFRHQAIMDMLFATLKVGLTIALVAAGFAIAGALGGFLITAAVMLVVSAVVLGRQRTGETVSWKSILSFEWKTLLFAFFLNGMMQIDLQFLKAMAPANLGTTSHQTGIYGAALQVGQIPYVATISVAFVIFPLISKATFDNDLETARQYVRTTFRYVLLLLAGIVAPVALESGNILQAIYPHEYWGGADIFAILCIGYLFFAGMVVGANVLTGSGRPMTSAALFGGALAVSAGLCALLIPHWGGEGAAWATCGAMFVGFLGFGVACHLKFGTFIPRLTPVRVAVAVAGVYALARYVLPSSPGIVWVAARLAVLFIVYLVLLAVTRELSGADVQRLKSLRRKSPAQVTEGL